jgi:PAP2 superfamily
MINRFLSQADKWRLGIIAGTLLIFLIAWPLNQVTIVWASFRLPFLAIAGVALLGLAYRGLNRDERIAAIYFVIAQMILFSYFAVFDNYLALELHRPLIDELLAGLDRALGIDWWAYVILAKSNPFMGRVFTYAYQSSMLQLIAVILFLGSTRRFARLDRLTLAFMIGGLVTIAVWVLFPNFGALALHYAQGLPDPPFHLSVSKRDAMGLLALHAGQLPPLRQADLTGLIGFPSFHTVMAVLTIYALWGIRFIGPLALAGNTLVLLSIPADGGHHVVDVAGGILVAFLAIGAAGALLRQHKIKQRYELRRRDAPILLGRALRFRRRQ